MKDTIKKIIGFLLTALAGALGLNESVEMFLSIGVIFAVVYGLTNLLKPYLKDFAQIFSWAAGILLCMAGWWLELGIMAEMTWWFALITGFLITLGANGVFDNGWIESVWNILKQLFTRKTVKA